MSAARAPATRARALALSVGVGLALPLLGACAKGCAGPTAPSPAPPGTGRAATARTATSAEAAAAGTAPRLFVPEAGGPITLDGELDEPAWKGAARTGAFLDPEGQSARPQSEARWLRDADHLYVALYAADEDLRAVKSGGPGSPDARGDAFRLRFGVELEHGMAVYLVSIGADGTVTSAREHAPGKGGAVVEERWDSHVRAAVDRDGTLDDASDDDEEWVVEAALPLAALGLDGHSAHTLHASLSRCDTPKDGQRRCGTWAGGGRGTTGAPAGILELAAVR